MRRMDYLTSTAPLSLFRWRNATHLLHKPKLEAVLMGVVYLDEPSIGLYTQRQCPLRLTH